MLEITEITLTQLRLTCRVIDSEDPKKNDIITRTDLNTQNWPLVGEYLNLFPTLPNTLATFHIHISRQFVDELFLITYANFIRQMNQLVDIGLIISEGWDVSEDYRIREISDFHLTELLEQIARKRTLQKFWFSFPQSFSLPQGFSQQLGEKAQMWLSQIAKRSVCFYNLQESDNNCPLVIDGLKASNTLEQLCCPDSSELAQVLNMNRFLRAIRISDVRYLETLQTLSLIAHRSDRCHSIEISLSPTFSNLLSEQWLILTDLFKSNITQLKIVCNWQPFIDDQIDEGISQVTIVEKMTGDIIKLLTGRTNLKVLSIPIIWNGTDQMDRSDYFAKRVFNSFRSNLCRIELLDLTPSLPDCFLNPITIIEFFKLLVTNTYLKSIRLGHLWTQVPSKRAYRDVYHQTVWNHNRTILFEKIEECLQHNYTIIEIDFPNHLLDSKSKIPNILKRNMIIRNELASLVKMGFDNHHVRTLPHRFASRFRGSLNLNYFNNVQTIREIFQCFRLQIQHDSPPAIRMAVPSALPLQINSFQSAVHRKIYEMLVGSPK